MNRQLPWDFQVLSVIKDGKPTNLTKIYAEIDKVGREAFCTKPESFQVDGTWGDRPDYTHTVRTTMSRLKKRGMVEHLGKGRTGMYQITDKGRKQLEEVEP